MPHWAPPESRKDCCRNCKRPSEARPSIVTIFAPFACSAGIRQLFTSIPSIKTEQEPHSPSPQPSFVPVNPSSCRRTSSRRSIGYACTDSNFPFTVNEISHFARFLEESVIRFLAPRGARSRERRFRRAQRRCPPEAAE